MPVSAVSTMARPRARLHRLTTARLAVSLPKAVLGLAFLVGVSLALRTQAIHARFWIDEGLSVGISSHPFATSRGCCARTARRRSTTCCSACG